MAKILLVEDDKTTTEATCQWLEAERHTVEAVETGLAAVERLRTYTYDVIVLDYNSSHALERINAPAITVISQLVPARDCWQQRCRTRPSSDRNSLYPGATVHHRNEA